MALSIVAGTAAPALPGIEKTTSIRCDVFSGSKEALLVAGLITSEHLRAQPGRRIGSTMFLPSGEVCPPTRKPLREPGYMAVFCLSDGSYRVEVTVSEEEQLRRRKAVADAKQELVNREVEKSRGKYTDWRLLHAFVADMEIWEGTKAQLQAVGIGVGLNFPGEAGRRGDLYCKCPLGFDVRVYSPSYDYAKLAAGIFVAQSRYLHDRGRERSYVAHAEGVQREVWTPESWGIGSYYYRGSMLALLAAGLVPRAELFPGLNGNTSAQFTFQKDWSRRSTSPRQDWGATIRRLGKKGLYELEVPVPAEEKERRRLLVDAREQGEKIRNAVLASERRALREQSNVAQVRTTPNWSAAPRRAGHLRLVYSSTECR